MKKGTAVVIVLVVLLLAVSLAFAYYYGTQQGKTDTRPAAETTQTPVQTSPAPLPTAAATPAPQSNIPAGWLTYTNLTYKFEISYPPAYKALTDSNNLYGWPNAIVLIYGGGQSYDLAIEHWNSQAEYEAKYKNQSNVTVKKIGNVYITLLNTNFEAEVDGIIDTFTQL